MVLGSDIGVKKYTKYYWGQKRGGHVRQVGHISGDLSSHWPMYWMCFGQNIEFLDLFYKNLISTQFVEISRYCFAHSNIVKKKVF